MPAVLGLDLSKTTGVAFGCDRGPWFWWTISLNPRGRLRGSHFFNFQKQLGEALHRWRPDLVVFEEVEFAEHRLAYRINAILCGLVMVACESRGLPYKGVPVKTLKKFAGNGNASKEMMRTFAERKLFGSVIPEPLPPDITHDEIDAVWLAAYGLKNGRRVA